MEQEHCLPSWHVLGGITEEGDIVEDQTPLAAHLTGVPAIDAHVEVPAVTGLDVAGVVKHLAVGVDLGDVGAGEAVSENLCRR